MQSDPYGRNSNENSHLYRHVFVTDHEISKTKFPAEVICRFPIETARMINVEAHTCAEP